MSFMATPSFLQKIILIGILLTTVLSACDLFLCVRRKCKPYSYTIIDVIAFVVSAFVLVNLAVYADEDTPQHIPLISLQVAKVSVWIFLAIQSVLMSMCVTAIISGYKSDKRHITKMSVKESFDNLPSGICFYEDSGLLRLVNVKIDDLCVKITGKSLLSGVDFWKTLTSETPVFPNERVGSGETPMIKTDDGKVYSFKRISHETEDGIVYEIVATDITRRYKLSVDLEKKNTELEALNSRMRAYGEKIKELTAEKEMLNAKIRIHDELGKLLLSTRKSLVKDMTREERRELLSAWKNDLIAFGSTKSEKVADTYSGLYAAAKSVGVTLKISGKKPDSIRLKKIVLTAAVECVTNAVKHAKGDVVKVDLEDKQSFLQITVTNNGEPPKEKIKEGGGFSSLRMLVEREGGNMSIESMPIFKLQITVPKGEKI